MVMNSMCPNTEKKIKLVGEIWDQKREEGRFDYQMQSKISSFFKSSSSSTILDQPIPSSCQDSEGHDELALWENTQHQYLNTYKRRASISEIIRESKVGDELTETISKDQLSKSDSIGSGKVLNKKRSYTQFRLDLGQSDFNLRTCNICRVKYAPGEGGDEKEHKTFHKNFTQGVPFKGCRSERVVHMTCNERGRIVLVQDSDPISQRNKVQEVIKMMEIELGEGWIFHKLCKVYLFISCQRVVGYLVAEAIKEAFRVVPSSVKRRSESNLKNKSKSNSATLRFGEIILQREVIKKVTAVSSVELVDENHNGAIVCEEKTTPAICGIRAIWVTPLNRRKRIASQLLDAASRSFCTGSNLKVSQLAFSPPTSAGKALAASYTSTQSFMVYKPQTLDS